MKRKRIQAVVRNITLPGYFLTKIFAITDIRNELFLFRKGGGLKCRYA